MVATRSMMESERQVVEEDHRIDSVTIMLKMKRELQRLKRKNTRELESLKRKNDELRHLQNLFDGVVDANSNVKALDIMSES